MEWQIRMPTVKIIGPYRFFFFSNEGNELPYMMRNQSFFWRHGMRTSLAESVALALAVRFSADDLIVDLSDGRIISVPLAWFPRLLHAHRPLRGKSGRLSGMESVFTGR
jgi:hypothetical protein